MLFDGMVQGESFGSALREIAPFPENSERDQPVSFKTSLRLNFPFLWSTDFQCICLGHTGHALHTYREGGCCCGLLGWPVPAPRWPRGQRRAGAAWGSDRLVSLALAPWSAASFAERQLPFSLLGFGMAPSKPRNWGQGTLAAGQLLPNIWEPQLKESKYKDVYSLGCHWWTTPAWNCKGAETFPVLAGCQHAQRNNVPGASSHIFHTLTSIFVK